MALKVGPCVLCGNPGQGLAQEWSLRDVGWVCGKCRPEKAPENCDCECHPCTGGFCERCAGLHIAVLRHTVAKLKGEWHLAELVEHGGLLKEPPPKYGTLPGHSLGT